MAEKDNPQFNKNHALNLKSIRLDVYRLACHFESSAALSDAFTFKYLAGLQREFLLEETSRILLQCSTILRMLDDESEADREERDPFFCGILESQTGVVKLSLREACNKIIHARQINFDEEPESESGSSYFKPQVYLYGTQSNSHWKATVDLREYLEHAGRLLVTRSLSEFLDWKERYSKS